MLLSSGQEQRSPHAMNAQQRRHFCHRLLLATGVSFFSAPIQQILAESGSRLLVEEHPRLLLRKEDWEALARHQAAGLVPEKPLADIHRSARKILKQETSQRVLEGRRLLAVSREVARRTVHLAFSHRTGGPSGSDRRAIDEMMAAAGFSDWNPSHFLDVAEMTAALAVGYDWLYDRMSPAERATIAKAILTKGLQPAAELARRRSGFTRMRNNWNQVCWGGILLGALAIGDEHPKLLNELLASARATMPTGLAPLQPEGVYPEGPGYWEYGSIYQVLSIEAMRTALGDDGGLARNPAWLASADFYLHAAGPSGAFYNFADCGAGKAGSAAMVWMAREKKNVGYLLHEKRRLADGGTGSLKSDIWDPLAIAWWPAAAAMRSEPLPLHWHGQGENPVAFWRSSWDAPEAVYLAIKAGGAPVSHGHMDAGSFVLDAMGVRWAHELSPESYHRVESIGVGLWNFQQNSDRWKLFRLNHLGHNTLVVGGEPHSVDQRAKLLRADEGGAMIDFASALGPACRQATREVEWLENSVVLKDFVTTGKPGTDVRWAMNTRADCSVEGRRIILREDGKILHIDFDLPEGTSIEVLSIEQPGGEWDSPNPGFQQVHVLAKSSANGTCAIKATFSGW